MLPTSTADLRAFIEIARRRSFRAAADSLGTSRSALSHAMRSLEDQLGVRLLNRTTRSVAPTLAGERLLTRLVPVLRELEAVIDSAADQSGEPSGSLRINGPANAIRMLLNDVVPAYLSRYPAMTLELSAEGRLIDIVEQGFDAGIRLQESLPQDMIAVPIGADLRFVALASPAYLARHGVPAAPEDLHRHRCIRQRLPSGKPYRWEFQRHGAEFAIDVPGALTLDDVGLMIQAACGGLGIAFVPESAARAAIDAAQLQLVLEPWCPRIAGLHLYFPNNRHVPAGLRALIDLIRQQRESLAQVHASQ